MEEVAGNHQDHLAERWAAMKEEAKFFESRSVVHNNKNNNNKSEEQPTSSQSSIGSPSFDTSSSCFSDEDDDDASSSSPTASSSNSSSSSTLAAKNNTMNENEEEDDNNNQNSPLYELSQLMSQLPIKRGLSRFYDGKSQSYTSVGSVERLEDLVKKLPSGRIMKMRSKCKSFCWGVERQRKQHCYGPKPSISKKGGGSSSRVSCFSSLAKTTPSPSSSSASPSVHRQIQTTTYLV